MGTVIIGKFDVCEGFEETRCYRKCPDALFSELIGAIVLLDPLSDLGTCGSSTPGSLTL